MTIDNFVATVTKAGEDLAGAFTKSADAARQHLAELVKAGEQAAESAWPAATSLADDLSAGSRESFEGGQKVSALWLSGGLLGPDGGFSDEGKVAIAAASAWIPSYFKALSEGQKLFFQAQRSLLAQAARLQEATLGRAGETTAEAVKYGETCIVAFTNLALDGTEAPASGRPASWYEVIR